jgi:hypothetical protein
LSFTRVPPCNEKNTGFKPLPVELKTNKFLKVSFLDTFV